MSEVHEWYVVFGEFFEKQSRWHIFTRPGWRHVLAFGWSGDRWIIVDPMSHRMGVMAVEGKQLDEMIVGFGLMNAKILRMKRAGIHRLRAWEPLYCVSVIKHLLGLDGFALTPEQLYRLMLRRGAVPAFK
jgi:hypothetical protein